MLHCDSWVMDDFGAAIITTDHSATCAEWSFEGTGHAHLGRRQARQLDFCNLDFSKIQASLQPLVDLGQDPHSHAAELQRAVEHALRHHQVRRGAQPVKKIISPSNWALVQKKRQCRKQLAEATHLQCRAALGQFFSAWKYGEAHRATLDAGKINWFPAYIMNSELLAR